MCQCANVENVSYSSSICLFTHLPICKLILIVTFLAFQATDIFYGYAVHFTGFNIVVEFLVNAVKLVARAVVIVELHFRFTVTVDAPAHA